jgi:hypothetical protein
VTARRFPPPWSVEEQDACFVVRDHNGQQLAYVYLEDEPGLGGEIARAAHCGEYRETAASSEDLIGAHRLT